MKTASERIKNGSGGSLGTKWPNPWLRNANFPGFPKILIWLRHLQKWFVNCNSPCFKFRQVIIYSIGGIFCWISLKHYWPFDSRTWTCQYHSQFPIISNCYNSCASDMLALIDASSSLVHSQRIINTFRGVLPMFWSCTTRWTLCKLLLHLHCTV